MKNRLKDYFILPATDRKGIIALCFILLAILALPSLFPYLLRHPPEDFSRFESDLAVFRQNLTDRQAESQREWAESR